MLLKGVVIFALAALSLTGCDNTPSSPTAVVQSNPTTNPDPTAGGPQSIEGAIESIRSSNTIVIGGQSITLGPDATIRSGSARLAFADLRVGARARVAGARDGQGTLRASLVEVLDAVGVPTNTHGIIQGFSGDNNGFQFRFGSQLVRGDSTTRILDAGRPVSIESLRNGVSSDVGGILLSEHLHATTIGIDSSMQAGPPTGSPSPSGPSPSPGPSPGPGSDVTITGVMGPISGSCPAITFPISGQVVVTNSGTAFVGGSCEGLAAGGIRAGQRYAVGKYGRRANGDRPIGGTVPRSGH